MNKTFIYTCKGTCARKMTFELMDNTIVNVDIEGGCDGNLTGIAKIVRNMSIDYVIDTFQGVPCGRKATSCPDQMAKALKQYKKQM